MKPTDNSYDSHPNQSKQQDQQMSENLKQRKLLHSTIKSDSDWESDGPIQFAPNPNQKFTDNKRVDHPSNCPQRKWDSEGRNHNQPSSNIINSVPTHFQHGYHGSQQSIPVQQSYRESSTRAKSPQRPKTIREVSYQVSATGQGEEEIVNEKAVYHDGFEVYRSTAHKKKIKKLEKLNNKSNLRDLRSAKEPIKYRFVLTIVPVEFSEEDIEQYLLSEFDEIVDVYIRKNEMKRHSDYASFVVFVNCEEKLDVRAMEEHEWPGKIRCFFAPNPTGRRG